jgi:hypothetical protein
MTEESVRWLGNPRVSKMYYVERQYVIINESKEIDLQFAYTVLPLKVFNISYMFRSFLGHLQGENIYKGCIKHLYDLSLENVPHACIKQTTI